MSETKQMAVPTDAVLGAVAGQRNTAMDELAKAQVLIDQLVAERDELAAEVERLRSADEMPAVV